MPCPGLFLCDGLPLIYIGKGDLVQQGAGGADGFQGIGAGCRMAWTGDAERHFSSRFRFGFFEVKLL